MKFKPHIGQPVSRLEGEMKVTGTAKYAADYDVPNLLYGFVVNSSITRGTIKSMNVEEVQALPGVVKVFTHENRPRLAWFDIHYTDMDAPPGTVFKFLSDNKIHYNGQPLALVIAETFETARFAASQFRVEYSESNFEVQIGKALAKGRNPKKGLASFLKPPPPKPTGEFEKAFNTAASNVTLDFYHAHEHHNPMELFASTVIYEGKGKLTIYDKTQGTNNSQLFVANVFGLKYKNVTVLTPFMGGGFGSGLRPQYQLFFSVMAALDLKRNVRVMMDRKQMFTFGHRPESIQRTRFAADADGKISALGHSAVGETSRFEDYTENVVTWSHMLYPATNTHFDYKITPVDVYTPLDMRGPGGVTGMHAVEVTMDELACKLNIDPLEFRLKNYADKNPADGKPFTSKELKQCYQKAAEQFGWSNREAVPGSMRRGNKLVGYGMATGIWEAMQMPARIEVCFTLEGKLIVNSAVTDIGVGTFTVVSQIAADELGLALDDVIFHYGNSKNPLSFVQGGSFTTASVGTAVSMAISDLKKKFFRKAKSVKDSPFRDAKASDIIFCDGKIALKQKPGSFLSLTSLVEQNGGRDIRVKKIGYPHSLKLKKYSRASHSAAFVEVEVDEDLKTIEVTRAITAVAAGKIINPKTARSQVLGGMIWGMSMALREATILDENLGKFMNCNLAEYHIPVHADIHEFDVIFAEENDGLINELGVKGVGEIGGVAMPAAISNAIYNATGTRLRNLPMHFDELL